jgi:hypothetical protein
MSEKKHSETIFANEKTRQRRAWIDRALAGVRGNPEPGEEPGEVADTSRKPHLVVVSSNRSG